MAGAVVLAAVGKVSTVSLSAKREGAVPMDILAPFNHNCLYTYTCKNKFKKRECLQIEIREVWRSLSVGPRC